LGALIVTEEHRYYGATQPFSTITTDNLQYLSSRQALNDLADFIVFIQNTVLNGNDNAWFTIGGSYRYSLLLIALAFANWFNLFLLL